MEEIPKHPDGGSTASEPAAAGSIESRTATQPTATSSAKDAAAPPLTGTGSTKDSPAARHTRWILPAFAGLLGGFSLAALICSIPAPAQTFVSLSTVSGVLIVGGLVTLIVLIPAAGGSNSDIKTEFFSARAAYLCVITGLVLLGIVAIGAVFARVMLTVGGR